MANQFGNGMNGMNGMQWRSIQTGNGFNGNVQFANSQFGNGQFDVMSNQSFNAVQSNESSFDVITSKRMLEERRFYINKSNTKWISVGVRPACSSYDFILV